LAGPHGSAYESNWKGFVQLPEDQQPEWIVKVRYFSEDDKYWTEIVNFGHKFVHIPDRFVRQYDRPARI